MNDEETTQTPAEEAPAEGTETTTEAEPSVETPAEPAAEEPAQ